MNRPYYVRLTALLALCWISFDLYAQNVDVVKPGGEWVTDKAGFLSDSEKQLLSQKLAGYADTTSNQIIIVTLPSLDGADAMEYAINLGRAWKVGQEGNDNGVVILVSREDRQIAIAVGYGLEGSIPDAVADRIRRNIMVPEFREGRFFEGLSASVDALIQAAAGEFKATETVERRESRPISAATILVVAIIAFFVISAIKNNRGGGRGGRRNVYRRHGVPPVIIWGGGGGWGSGGSGFGGGGGGFGGGGFGGFSGGGGSFGGGGASGGW